MKANLAERRLAATESIKAALLHLDEDAERLGVEALSRDQVRRVLEHDLESARRTGDDVVSDERTNVPKEDLLLAVITRKRAALKELRDRGRIDDGVLMRAQSHLDIEELWYTKDLEE